MSLKKIISFSFVSILVLNAGFSTVACSSKESLQNVDFSKYSQIDINGVTDVTDLKSVFLNEIHNDNQNYSLKWNVKFYENMSKTDLKPSDIFTFNKIYFEIFADQNDKIYDSHSTVYPVTLVKKINFEKILSQEKYNLAFPVDVYAHGDLNNLRTYICSLLKRYVVEFSDIPVESISVYLHQEFYDSPLVRSISDFDGNYASFIKFVPSDYGLKWYFNDSPYSGYAHKSSIRFTKPRKISLLKINFESYKLHINRNDDTELPIDQIIKQLMGEDKYLFRAIDDCQFMFYEDQQLQYKINDIKEYVTNHSQVYLQIQSLYPPRDNPYLGISPSILINII